MKEFNRLTKAGQTRRLNKYEQERQELSAKYDTQVENDLFTVVREAKIRETTKGDGSKSAIFRLVHRNAQTGKSEFVNATAFIPAGKTSLEEYYANVAKKQLVTVDFVKQNDTFIQIWKMMSRERATK